MKAAKPAAMATSYAFEAPLVRGVIKARPNRFIMEVSVPGQKELQRCHCPTTGRIGNVVFKDIPCLLSKGSGKRTTAYTVEAISLASPAALEKPGAQATWIGINQTRANRFVEHFLATGQLENMLKDGHLVKRERTVGASRIDFSVGDRLLLEVKSPLMTLYLPDAPTSQTGKDTPVDPERLIKHFTALSNSLVQWQAEKSTGEKAAPAKGAKRAPTTASDAIALSKKKQKTPAGAAAVTTVAGDASSTGRAIVLLCFMYDAPTFVPPVAKSAKADRIVAAVSTAVKNGVENWQINMAVDEKGVRLLRCMKLDLLPHLAKAVVSE
jgi:sugar fermentation stimulation protein A